jgi:hypothetical protein
MVDADFYQCFSIINNTDESILSLNSIIQRYGHVLVKVKIGEFQKVFGELIPHDNLHNGLIHYSKDNSITGSFWSAIQQSPIIGHTEQMNGYIIILRNNQKIIIKEAENLMKALFDQFENANEFTGTLLRQLRLLKSGDIYSNSSFIKGNTNRIFAHKHSGPFADSNKYTISDSELSSFKLILTDNSTLQVYLNLALNNFELSYNQMNNDLRYLTLITCLEVLFNIGGGLNINHTISRHLALTVSKSKDEFLINYNEAKNLYNHRNKIIHGSSINTSLEKLNNLYDYVRQSISYCLNLNLTRDELFNYLNSKGYE